MPLLEVTDLRTYFHTREGTVRAVDGISYTINKGETLGIVGESGSGKSVSCYSLLGLLPMPPGRIESGRAMFNGVDLLTLPRAELRKIRGREISMIFQDPMTALNPYMSIGAQLMEPLRVHERASKVEARRRAIEALTAVGIQDGERGMGDFPHQYSGGMRQRVMIAMALITRPKLLIADEPTTALDVTVQAQILDLIKTLQRETGTAVILITHDLGVVAGACDRVLVMYAGRIMESASAEALLERPRHPYTQALRDSLPSAHTAGKDLYTIPGLPPDLAEPITGCPFTPRCRRAAEICRGEMTLREVSDAHETACVREQATVAAEA
ncbi:MAG: ABC transporter ATP-binding protein [Candidatus Hydrogenedentota bacterium]